MTSVRKLQTKCYTNYSGDPARSGFYLPNKLMSQHSSLTIYFSSAYLLSVFKYAKLFSIFRLKFFLLVLFICFTTQFLIILFVFHFLFLILNYNLHEVREFICLIFYSIHSAFWLVLRAY